MTENPFAEEPKPTAAWLWQVFTGVGLVILLGLHFIANHFVAKGGLRYFGEVVVYLRNPVILCLEVLFLLCVTTHALLGVRAIFLDFGLSVPAERRLDRVLKLVGALTVAYGLGVTWIVIR
jgi:succinate dehydrogenase hydrophobic anchor subunit